MRNKTVQIVDKNNNTFEMKISTPTAKGRAAIQVARKASKRVGGWLPGPDSGEWETVQKGFIRYHSGDTRSRLTGNGDITTRDLLILGEGGIKTIDGDDRFGMQLFQYEDMVGVNKSGEGTVIQPWVLGLTPGRIKWSIV